MRIYLASPYSSPDRSVRFIRYIHACRAAAQLMQAGLQVFSPIAHSHAVGEFMPPEILLDFDFWMHQDLPYVEHWADEVWVLMLDGHAQSRGIAREIAVAQAIPKPVRFLAPEDVEVVARGARTAMEKTEDAAAFAKSPFEPGD